MTHNQNFVRLKLDPDVGAVIGTESISRGRIVEASCGADPANTLLPRRVVAEGMEARLRAVTSSPVQRNLPSRARCVVRMSDLEVIGLKGGIHLNRW